MAKLANTVDANLELFPILPSYPAVGTGSPSTGTHLTGIARLAAASSPAGEGHRLEVRSLGVRSILNRSVSRRGLSFTWTINPIADASLPAATATPAIPTNSPPLFARP